MTCISKEGGCLCLDKARFRGLCDKHYQRYRKQVAERLTTWKKLTQAGKCLAKTRVRGRMMMGGAGI